MLLALYTCLLWLSTSGLWTAQAKDSDADMSIRSQHRNLAPNNVDFAFGLYKHLVASTPGKNVFISPVSISTALAMLSLGARGYTRAQLLQGLGFNLTDTSEAKIHQGFRHLHRLLRESDTTLEIIMGNALFLNQSLELLESFSADTKHYYELDTVVTDLRDWARAHKQINEHIKNKTQGKIVDLFSELDSPAMLILVNYIFFKGTWAHPFDLASTKEENFYVNETTLVKVPMMFQSNKIKYLNDPVLPCQLVQLDYLGNGTVFLILPDKGQIDVVIKALSRDTMQRWSDSLTSGPVDLYIPKVSISGAQDLGDLLEDMGIADLLTNQENFSGITQKAQLKVSKVIHKATLQLDEKGVEEAAPTGVTGNEASEPLTIHFNRPFIIMIFDHFTWSSLFLVKGALLISLRRNLRPAASWAGQTAGKPALRQATEDGFSGQPGGDGLAGPSAGRAALATEQAGPRPRQVSLELGACDAPQSGATRHLGAWARSPLGNSPNPGPGLAQRFILALKLHHKCHPGALPTRYPAVRAGLVKPPPGGGDSGCSAGWVTVCDTDGPA